MALISRQTTRIKIALIIALLAITLPVAMFRGSIDEFSPKHTALIEEASSDGKLVDDPLTGQVPGYYAYGVVVGQTSGLSGKELAYLPILPIPFAVIFFALIYALSRNVILSGSILLIEMSSGIAGTSRIFFWMNGLGSILFYLSLVVLLSNRQSLKKRPMIFDACLLVMGASLIFISYNLTGMLFALLLSLIALQSMEIMRKMDGRTRNWRQRIALLVIALAVIELVFSGFFFNTFIPTMLTAQTIELGGIDKLLASYFSSPDVPSSISGLIQEFSMLISLVSVLRYLIIFAAIATFTLVMMKAVKRGDRLNANEILTASVVLMAIVYSIPRLYIGSITVTFAFLPGILCLVWISKRGRRSKNLVITAVAVLLALTLVYYAENHRTNMINNDPSRYATLEPCAEWYYEHLRTKPIASDELSKNLMILNLIMAHGDFSYSESSNSFEIMRISDVEYVTRGSGEGNDVAGYLMNYRLNSVTLQNWITLKPWKISLAGIDSNLNLNEVYDNGDVSILLKVGWDA